MITAKIVADSISRAGDRITTFELVYPRFIHSEFMTHRLFSRNAASSRAIPIDKIMAMIENEPAMPFEWGKNQAGMQAKEVCKGNEIATCEWVWKKAAQSAVHHAKQLQAIGLHKQIVNRVMEPFVHMKTIVTATEWDNWWWLRNHEAAAPEIHELAKVMLQTYNRNEPYKLNDLCWHMPYYLNGYWHPDSQLTLKEALKISGSCCAQVSFFRPEDDGLEKAERIYDRLVTSVPVHASPFEHQAKPMEEGPLEDMHVRGDIWPEGITHCGPNAEEFWSGNFKGWIQHRQLIPNNVCWDYKDEVGE